MGGNNILILIRTKIGLTRPMDGCLYGDMFREELMENENIGE